MDTKMNNTAPGQSLELRLVEFAGRILDLTESLPKKATAKHLGGQIMRSGTAPALNYGEARGAESKDDFAHKMKVCLKELRETSICLAIIENRKWFSEDKLKPLLDECNQLISIFVASIKTLSNKKQNHS